MKTMQTKFLVAGLIIIGLSSCSGRFDKQEGTTVSGADSSLFYSELALSLYQSGDVSRSKEMYLHFLKFDTPQKLSEIILEKRLFFVPDTFSAPEHLVQEQFILKPIRTIHAELDYKAIMSSVEHLTGVLGRRSWPGDLTLEENRKVLESHEWEFENRVGFVYTVMNKSETEIIGCLYIYPSRLDDYDAEIGMWVTEQEYHKGTDDLLFNAVKEWLVQEWPFSSVVYPGREINWGEFYTKLEVQDQKYTQ